MSQKSDCVRSKIEIIVILAKNQIIIWHCALFSKSRKYFASKTRQICKNRINSDENEIMIVQRHYFRTIYENLADLFLLDWQWTLNSLSVMFFNTRAN